MNPISKAIGDLRFKIPRQILERYFANRSGYYSNSPVSIEEMILMNVVRPRVMVDCDLVGGVMDLIWLGDVPREDVDEYQTVYRIPKSKTQNRTIVSALNLTFGNPTMYSTYGAASSLQNSALLQATQALLDANSTPPITSTHRIQIIGENTILVRDVSIVPENIYLRCMLSNDENLSHLQARSYLQFGKLVEYAVKSYIYMEYIIAIDRDELYGGATIGKFKEIVEGYADAEQNYEEYLTTTWSAVAIMNDNETYTRLLKMPMGSYR